jgi:DNA modification methylase
MTSLANGSSKVVRDCKGLQLSIVYRSIEQLWCSGDNPRIHSDRQIRQIARSIEEFGFIVPLLIDASFRVVAGHGRFQAAKLLGFKEVPTISLEHLTEAQSQAFRIADNKLCEIATWDHALLAAQLKDLSKADLDFSVEITGFEIGEIDVLIEGLSPASVGVLDPADAVPQAATFIQVTKAGDLWLAGPHRIYCGNALHAKSFFALMGSQKAAAVFTDPPFNLKIHGHVGGLGKIRHREFPMASGEMTEAEFIDFLTVACRLLAANSVDGSLHFVCMDWRHIDHILQAGKHAYSEFKNLCVWVKDNGGMGSLYRSQHELVFVFKNGKGSHRNNVQLGQYGRYRTNVWTYPGANTFSRCTDVGNLLELHPTVKPVQLVADAVLDCTARGEIVLDPFLGSGTTVIAAERTGRRCYGIEIDPAYVDTIIRRWQAFTGLSAIHGESGRRFADLEQEAE